VGGVRPRAAQNERALLELFGRLDPAQQDELVSFAEFLAGGARRARSDNEPVLLARPARETVTAAIRRLVRSYPMLERRKLMAEASRLLAQHALEGRAAVEVIDDLEAAFARQLETEKGRGKGRRA